VDRITRKGLKQDKFAVEFQHTVGYLTEHRTQSLRWGAAGAAAIVLIAGFFTWRSHEGSARRTALAAALELRQTPVGPPQADSFVRPFPTEQEKIKAEIAKFSDIASKYPSSGEGIIAEYYLAAIAADQGNMAGAAKALKEVIDSGNANYASLAKLSLATIYKSEGKISEGENLIREVIAKPSEFVSQEQARIALAQYVASSNPAEARTLLEPLLTSNRKAITQAASTELGSLPPR
jgi:predicted negative regulator of RcsB-dependent stress response